MFSDVYDLLTYSPVFTYLKLFSSLLLSFAFCFSLFAYPVITFHTLFNIFLY